MKESQRNVINKDSAKDLVEFVKKLEEKKGT